MSVWRRKALECLPEYRQEIEDKGSSLYTAMSCLLTATEEAHKHQDTSKLKQYYGFAEWCFRQKEKDLWNAVAVSFYEHLGDSEDTFAAMHLWVKADVYKDVKGLIELRVGKEKIYELDIRYFGKSTADKMRNEK